MAVRGRHRRHQPSRINRASLTVTAGGAGIALPLIGGAGPADAASVDAREKVAACEAAGNWQINTGNGHYGGLRFSRSAWKECGGTAHAPRAGLAAPDVRPQQAATPTTVPARREMYTVARGDSLSGIAQARRVKGGWQALYETNRTVVGADPDLIFPGQRLRLEVTAPRPAKSAAPPGPEAREDRRGQPRAKSPQPKKAQPEKARPERAQPEKARPEKQQREERGDRAGRPAARGHFSAPVAAGTGTPYRKAGAAWASGYHTGVDFPVPTGTSVRAVAAGRVVSAGWAGAYGYEIVIRHTDGRYSQYAHLSALNVREGQQVNGGQRIARSGSTGNSSGPHLHFEVRTGPGYGSDVDPLAYLRARGVTV
ncbi:peptidoglycan DD-metalloendopeptidase family protein [Streptomyces sp. FIT100]|uniref:peptidoglycan DD-metalloendopeptidase family protein n=1 Tax=Streptomyces sp. FIT100 TaxID=2837956 RepID=UPI0021C7D58D|nr:peptidoglycan DD-metalloendopeptidase family protein [Streptomyces sp. FIT100]UUN30488.1 M23 family metallopeptidase [Streptomyces sp. FIT100]